MVHDEFRLLLAANAIDALGTALTPVTIDALLPLLRPFFGRTHALRWALVGPNIP